MLKSLRPKYVFRKSPNIYNHDSNVYGRVWFSSDSNLTSLLNLPCRYPHVFNMPKVTSPPCFCSPQNLLFFLLLVPYSGDNVTNICWSPRLETQMSSLSHCSFGLICKSFLNIKDISSCLSCVCKCLPVYG